MPAGTLYITGEPEADRLLNTDPLALVLGMLLDQQIPMEWAFKGPSVLLERAGGRLDATALAAMGEDAVVALFVAKPALHRFPASMGKRAYEVCAHIAETYGGDTAAIWRGIDDAGEVFRRIRAMPGYGEEKAQILLAILAKRLGVRPAGWEAKAGRFGDDTPRSVADIDSPEALAKVREYKKAMKAAKRDKQGEPLKGSAVTTAAGAKKATAKTATATKAAANKATATKATAKKVAGRG